MLISIEEHNGHRIVEFIHLVEVRHLVKIAGDAGLHELIAEVLPENRAMLKVFGKYGFKPVPRHDPQTVHLVLKLVCGSVSP